jgi:Zn-finger nucleic acid-binding protein
MTLQLKEHPEGLALMICPVCRKSMLVVEYNKVELDYCETCKGVWFDSGELELLLGMEKPGSLVADMLKSPEAKSNEAKRKCPICAQKMKKSILGQEPKVLVDVCRRGHGLWLDGGEVGQLLKQMGRLPKAEPGEQKVVEFIKEVFKA